MKIDESTHLDMTDGAPLVCACGNEQTIEQTRVDPLMYTDDYETAECDACREAAWAWPREVAVSRWEDEQR